MIGSITSHPTLSGDNLDIMDNVLKLLKRAVTLENFQKLQLKKVNKCAKKSIISLKMRNVASNIWMLN